MKIYKIISLSILVLIGLGFLNFTHTADAALVTCDTSENPKGCTICDLVALAKRIIDFILFELAPAIAVLLYLWAGFTILLGSTPLKIGEGKTIFWNTTVGLVIMFSAWMITNTILKSLAADSDVADAWYKIECREPGGVGTPVSPTQKYSCNSNNQCVADSNGQYTNSNCDNKCAPPGGGGVVGGGTCTGTSCSGDTLSCGSINPGDGCSASRVNAYNQDIAAGAGNISICPGVDTVKLLKAVIANESSGVINVTSFDGSSFGLFQMKPDTANQSKYKGACNVAVAENINSNWLKRRDTVTKQACIAAQILKDSVSSCGCDVRQLAAGYNGGSQGACDISTNCGPEAASAGSQCSMCANQSGPTKRWECLWDDNQHKTCNSSSSGGGFSQTRSYVPRVEYCYGQFGGVGSLGDSNPQASAPEIISFTPSLVTAGIVKSMNINSGMVTFADLEQPIEIKGTNLTGATLIAAVDGGIDGKPAIEFKNIQATESLVKATMVVHPTAKDGKTAITITNKGGKIASSNINISITGTQYLQRKFASNPNIRFQGDWGEPAPNQVVLDLESRTNEVAQTLKSGSYKNLNIIVIIYELKFWELKALDICGLKTALGCAGPSTSYIYLKGVTMSTYLPESLLSNAFHEMVHKLHFYENGIYKGVPNAPQNASGFQKEWTSSLGVINPPDCQFLPLINAITWKDGGSNTPHCGFIWAYGASDLKDYYEDVATMAETYKYELYKFTAFPETKTDPRYKNKVDLLKKYGFL